MPHRFARYAIASALALGLALPPTSALAQESALEGLRSASRASPRDYDAQVAYGRALIEAGRYREAQAAMRRASRLHRNDPAGLYEVARVAFAQREYRSARNQCRSLQRRHPDSAVGHVCMARAWIAWNRSARAFEELDAALEATPDDYETLLALGDAHRLRGAVDEAESFYQRAIRASAQAAEPHYGLGLLYANARRRGDALRSLRRAHELDGDDPDVDYELGRLLEGSDAITHLREAVQNRRGFGVAQVALGEALLDAGEATEAVEVLRDAARDRDLVSARSALGRALVATGANEEAESTLRDALERVPNDAASVMALAEVLAATERVEEAYEQYRHAADLTPRDPAPLLAASRLALQQERPVLATAFLQRVIQTQANNAPALAMLGDIMAARRQTSQARTYYQRALRGEGTFDRARVQAALRALPAN